MITVEQAIKDRKTRRAVEDESKPKVSSKKILIVVGIGVAAYLGYRMLKGKNEKVSPTY